MDQIRNIAIIAHVDHGKTTLVDKMIHAGDMFSEHENPGDDISILITLWTVVLDMNNPFPVVKF